MKFSDVILNERTQISKNNLPTSWKKYEGRIESISDEREYGNGIWIFLKKPWWSPDMEGTQIREDSVSDCLSMLKKTERATPEIIKKYHLYK